MKILDCFHKRVPATDQFRVPYIIAEAGVNHEGSMDVARKLIELAVEGGADAIKFQTYRARTLAVKESPAYWDTEKENSTTQFELFKKHDRFWKPEFEELKSYCDQVGIEFMSTPFDLESAEFLSELMDVFKISSSDITNKPFIEAICRYGKPIILSTGASNINEIDEALTWIDASSVPVALLHCILNYPTDETNAHLGMISGLKQRYANRIIGYSDHTLPSDMKSLEVATLLGAQILEKHFTHDKSLSGNDHYHAMDSVDLNNFLDNIRRTANLIGEYGKRALEIEETSRRNARRSLVAACKVPAGAAISIEHLTWKRPAHGISPKFIDDIVGRIANKEINEDQIITWDMLS